MGWRSPVSVLIVVTLACVPSCLLSVCSWGIPTSAPLSVYPVLPFLIGVGGDVTEGVRGEGEASGGLSDDPKRSRIPTVTVPRGGAEGSLPCGKGRQAQC